MKTLSLMFLRGHPIHRGHEMIIEYLKTKENFLVVLINGNLSQHKRKTNPLTISQRLVLLNKMTLNIIVEPNPYDAISKLRHEYDIFELITGSDRDYEQMFKSLDVKYEIIRLHRDIIPISGTELRDNAKYGNYEGFKKGKPKSITDEQWLDTFKILFTTLN